MATGRDWRKTQFKPSFKGVPFEVDRDDDEGGRRIVTHEFPMRDVPFNEDLGASKNEFDVSGYVASDNADSEAAALAAVCNSRGPGILVLPTHGPILARCRNYKRASEKVAGKISFVAKFVREGAATALISAASLANLVFARSDAVSLAVAAFTSNVIKVDRQPDFVRAAASEAVRSGASVLEVVRTSRPIDPDTSAAQRVAIQLLYNAADSSIDAGGASVGSAFSSLVSIARAVGAGMGGAEAAYEFASVLREVDLSLGTSFATEHARSAAESAQAGNLSIAISILSAYAEGIARAEIKDRQTGIQYRADAAEYFDRVLYAISADSVDLFRAVSELRNSVIEYLSIVILDRAPVVAISANRRLPALWWSHRLYRDPSRYQELVDRSRVSHPAFMPTDFEALSS